MSRTIKEHDERRAELLQTAQQLFSTQGYETTSVADIIRAVGIAKGTFYHYFDSKLDLLDELVEQMTTYAISLMMPVAKNPSLTAVEKMNQMLVGVRDWKTDNRDFFLDILRPYFSDNNAIFRQKMKEQTIQQVSPLVADVLTQGVQEGVFDAPHPTEMAATLLRLSQGLGEETAALLLTDHTNPATFETIQRKTAVFHLTIERMLDAPPGSLHFVKLDDLAKWFEF